MNHVTAREALKQLIDINGAAILNNGKQCMSMLKDLSSREDRKSTRLNSSHTQKSRMPSSA